MVSALIRARLGCGSSSPSSNRIIKSTQAFSISRNGVHYRRHFRFGQPVVAKNFGDFFDFHVAQFHGFANFTLALGSVVLEIRSRSEVSAQAHGDRSCGDFRQARGDHQRGGVRVGSKRAGNSGGQRERHGQAVGHSDDDVANRFRSR